MVTRHDTPRTPAPGLGAWSDPYTAGQLRWLVGTLATLADDLAARGDHHAARDTRRLLAAARRLRRTLTGEEGRDAV